MVFKLGGPGRSGIKNKKTNRPWWPDLEPKCVLYFPMNEGGGTFLRDHSGQNNHGTIHGASWSKGEALDFDGSDDYISVADSPSLDINSEITISVWVNLRTNPDPGPNYAIVVGKTATYPTSLLYDRSANKRYVWVGGDDDYIASTSGLAPENDGWHHIVATWATGSNLLIYVDGVLNGTSTKVYSGDMWDNSNNVLIGGGVADRYLNGIIDEVMVFNEALTAAQIKDLYEKGRSKHGV